MPKLIRLIGAAAILLLLMPNSSFANNLSPAQVDNFVPQTALCERQTFRLQSIAEIQGWFDYLSGLRSGRTEPPSVGCPSSTLKAIVGILSNREEAAARRIAFAAFYAAAAMEPESVDRAVDQSGNFRYLNDATLASFLWLLCPGTGATRGSCIENVVRELPMAYLETSPVFCDFVKPGDSSTKAKAIEWPSDTSGLPLLCSASDITLPSGVNKVKDWLARYESSISND